MPGAQRAITRLQDADDTFTGLKANRPAANVGIKYAFCDDTAEAFISNGTTWLPMNPSRQSAMLARFSGTRSTVSFAFTKFVCDSSVVYDYGANYNQSTGIYTVPFTGTYLLQGRIRLAEGVQFDNFGLLIDKVQDESINFMNWGNTATGASNGTNRQSFHMTRMDKFTAGDQLRMFYYWSNGNTYNVTWAELAIVLLHL
jgi:hypothetical protein